MFKPNNILTEFESYCFSGFEEVVNYKKRSFFFNLMLPLQPNKWPLVIKHINWVDNHQMIITAKYGLHHFKWLWKKMQISHFPIVSLWEISVAMATKPRDRSPYF